MLDEASPSYLCDHCPLSETAWPPLHIPPLLFEFVQFCCQPDPTGDEGPASRWSLSSSCAPMAVDDSQEEACVLDDIRRGAKSV